MMFSSAEASFQLEVMGYQFPAILNDPYDSNWLVIRIEVEHPKGHWEAQAPCLLTSELAKLADWLEAIDREEYPKPVMQFIEPNLSFHIIEPDRDSRRLRIYFELEMRPEWSQEWGIQKDLWVEFRIADLALSTAIQSLREQLAQFPPR
jgi:hypothetical protein